MTLTCTTVPLGQVITHRKEFITIDDLATYKRCRVQMRAQGIILRDVVAGAEVKTKEQQVCRAGEFLVAEIDAKVGGFGIVPEDLDGAIVSSHYFLFAIHSQLLDRRFLDYFARTPAFQEQVAAQGTTNYAAIRPGHVMAYQIPLPPLAEQRRIVASIEELAAKVEEAHRLRASATACGQSLPEAELSSLFAHLSQRHGLCGLERLLVDAGYGTSVKCEYEHNDEMYPVLRIPNIASETVTFEDLKYARLEEREIRRVALFNDDLLLVRTNGSADLVGRCAVVQELREPTAFASYLIRLRFNQSSVAPDYVQRMLRHLRGDGQLFDFARTTAGQYNISLGRLRAAQFPVPPLEEQHRIVAYLDELQAKVDGLKQLQAQTAAELDALLPSILDKAFKGEL